MTELISEVCQVAIEEKIANIGADMANGKLVSELREAREPEMASYFEGLQCRSVHGPAGRLRGVACGLAPRRHSTVTRPSALPPATPLT